MQFLFSAKNITHLFPIQSETFDFIYNGEDVMAQASKSRNIYVISCYSKMKVNSVSGSI